MSYGHHFSISILQLEDAIRTNFRCSDMEESQLEMLSDVCKHWKGLQLIENIWNQMERDYKLQHTCILCSSS